MDIGLGLHGGYRTAWVSFFFLFCTFTTYIITLGILNIIILKSIIWVALIDISLLSSDYGVLD